MKRFVTFPLAISLASLILTACATTSPNEGAGYELLKPSAASAAFIVREDRAFAEQVAAHNRQCRADEGCRK